jgi:hypothetical protein
MQDWFANGRVAELALLLLALEGAVLLALRRGPVSPLLAFLGAGAALLLALRAALLGLWWGWVAFWLAVSLPAHLAWLAVWLQPKGRSGR